ncbi:hypothetical protein AWC02_14945 [Mycolicibacter engbaekii]|uniref:Uncharacterized protein n=1 Tax=Mycolicibacter engbaekii TaxID=188915 RepID=A0A1X1TIZ3_9MYCO|nr:hypothetical protein [Mycolicibacter engbaekii]ORV44541.1 hypothetical protein AWC02_14945 [Mycolicibacter engbaekii]
MSAGDDLRAAWAAELAAADPALEWSPHELTHLDAACRAADRAEALRLAFAAEQAGEQRPDVLVKLSSELRMLDKAVADHLGRLTLAEDERVKSPQHQAAANARWDARRAQHEQNRQVAYGKA